MPTSARCTNSRKGRPAAAKREATQCDDHPDDLGTIRHGTAVSISQKMIACPKGRPNRSRHRYAVPRARGGQLHRSAAKSALFFWTVHGSFSFPQDGKGAPAAPRAVGRGGARERAQFSPQAETELSGLCDDDNGGCIAQLASQLNPPGGRLPPLRRPPPGERKRGGRPSGQPPRGLQLRQKSLEDPVLRLLRRQAQGLQL